MIPNTFQTGTNSQVQTIPWEIHEPTNSYDRAVVIAYGSDGLAPKWKPEIIEHAKALAAEGILALIPDYFQKIPAVSHNASGSVFLQIEQRHGEWAQVLQDAVNAAKQLSVIKADGVGLIGFSLGGFLGLRIRDSVNVLVEYFAPYQFPTIPFGQPFLEGLGSHANPKLTAHIHHGEADEFVPRIPHADKIKSDLKADGSKVSSSYYPGANHGFSGDDAANSDARSSSRKETVAFFKSNL